jgi:hypothetical protein
MDSDLTPNRLDEDLQKARDMYYHLLQEGLEAISLMQTIAQETEHPRSIEVLSGLLGQMGDINGKIIDLHKKEKDIKRKEINQVSLNDETAGAAYIGTVADLQRMITSKHNSNMIDISPQDITEKQNAE